MDLVLANYWHIEMVPVLLKWWSPLFDLEREQIGAGPLWVRLPRLPLHYWSEDVLIRIGNALGSYLHHDRTFVESKNRTLARVLVQLDTREGLEEKITLQWGKYSRTQILDYEGVPFRCRWCHRVGHLYKEFPLNRKPEDSPKVTPIPSRGNSPVISRPLSGPSLAALSSPQKTRTMGHGSISLPMTRDRAATEAAHASGISLNPSSIAFENSSSMVVSSAQISMAHYNMSSPPLIASSAPSLHSPSSSSISLTSSRVSITHQYFLRSRSHYKDFPNQLAGLG